MQPNEPEVAAFFAELIQNHLQNAPIQCGYAGEKKGKAIYAAKALKAGEPVWTEAPFVAMQHEDNKEFVDACENCFVPLINSKEAWERVLASSAEEKDVATQQDFEDAVAFLQKEGGKSAEDSYFSVFHLAANQVKCECGVIYCSEKCKQIAYAEHHAIVCTHSEDNETPMGHFVNHTLVTNEIFQLAAKVMAKVLLRFIKSHDLAKARQQLDMFCKMPWWDVITSEDDIEEEGETLEEYRGRFKSLLSQTFDHFMTGLRDNLAILATKDELNGLSVDSVLSSADEILNLDSFSRIVGMFEMNNISMEIDHPFHALAEALSEASSEDKKDMPEMLVRVKNALEKFSEEHKIHFHDDENEDGHTCDGHDHTHSHEHAHEHAHSHEDDNEEDDEVYAMDDDFVGVEGTALFSGICSMNHSCDPNCTVLYTKDGAAHVFAVHDIEEGEELCISYIDVDQDVEDRRECLR
ncbi:putative histone tail methylase containing set domain, partial [Globisporangium splendens]